MKHCGGCTTTKPRNEFGKNRSNKGGLDCYCRPCRRKASRKHRRQNEDRSSLQYRANRLYGSAQYRSGKSGLDFDLTAEWVRERLSARTCEVTGLPFLLDAEANYHPFRPSLDRIDPERGYTKDNVQLVCWMYNAAKGVGTHDDVMKLAEALCTHRKN